MHHFDVLRLVTDSMVQSGLNDATIDDVNERAMEGIVKEELARVEVRLRQNANLMLSHLSRKNRWADDTRPVKASEIKLDPSYNARKLPSSDGMRDNEFNAR